MKVFTGTRKSPLYFVVLFLCIIMQQTYAASGFTYTGRILDANDTPVIASNVRFTVTLYDDLGKCWLYSEQRDLDLSQSAGTFSFDIGSNDASLVGGTANFNGSTTGPQNLTDLFDNLKSFSGLGTANGCGGTYAPSPSDLTAGRVLSVYFSVSGGPNQALPLLKINPVPSALQAYSINGYGTGELLKVGTSINQTTNPNSALNQTQYDEFWNLITGISTVYLKPGVSFGGDASGTYNSLSVSKIKGQALAGTAPAAGEVLKWNGTAWAPAADATGGSPGDADYATKGLVQFSTNAATSGIVVSAGVARVNMGTSAGQIVQVQTGAKLPALDGSNLINITASAVGNTATLGPTKIWIGDAGSKAQEFALSGDATMTSGGVVSANKTTTAQANKLLSLDGSGIATASGIALVNTGTVTLSAQPASSTYGLTLPAAAPAANQSLQSDASGNLSWVTPLTSSTAFVNGGNTFAGNSSIGNNDNYNLDLKTNNTSRMTILNNGNVGIGTTNPSSARLVVPWLTGDTLTTLSIGSTNSSNNRVAILANSYSERALVAVSNSANAIDGYSSSAIGVYGNSTTSAGVYGATGSAASNVAGVIGSNTAGRAILGLTVNGYSIEGRASGTGYGVYGGSISGAGVYGTSTNGMSGRFQTSNISGTNIRATLVTRAATSQTSNLLEWQDTTGTAMGAITIDGKLGIGTSSPQGALDVVATGIQSSLIVPRDTTANRPTTLVNGMIRYNTTTNLFEFYENGTWVNYTTVSDGRLKTNVTPVSQGLNIVNQLKPIFFDWDQNNPRAQGFGTQHQVGFIAQEVEKVLPEVVNKGKDTYRSVEYGKIVAVLVAAIQEVYHKILGHEGQLQNLQRDVASLKQDKEVLKTENAALQVRLERIENALKSKSNK